MRFALFFAFLLFIDVYSFQAWKLMQQHWQPSWKLAANILFWMIPLAVLVMLALNASGISAEWDRRALSYLFTFFFITYLSKTCIIPFLAIDDLRRLLQWVGKAASLTETHNPGRSRFLTQFGLVMGSIPLFSLTYGMLRNPYRYRLFKTSIRLDRLPKALEGLRIVQISDIHSGSFTFKEPIKAAIDMINEQQPDLVFFTGDLVNNKSDEMLPYMDVFDKIKAKYGVFSIVGNHDYGDYVQWENEAAKTANFEQLKDIHSKLGWNLLLNENRLLQINGAPVAIIGVENYSAQLRFPKYGDLAKASQGTDQAALKLLLSHDPSHWDYEVNQRYPDIDVTFSGHTHGMQFGVEIPGWIKWSPIKWVYKQWAGLYEKSGQYLYVNRGLGFLGYPGRVGILPEVTLIELTRNNPKSEKLS